MYAELLILSFLLPAGLSSERQAVDANGRPTVTIFSRDGQENRYDYAADPDTLISDLARDVLVAGEAAELPLEYLLDSVYADTDGTFMHYSAHAEGIRVAESEIIVVLRPDGSLEGVSGTFWPRDAIPPSRESGAAVPHDLFGESVSKAKVEHLLHPRHGEHVVQVSFPDGRVRQLGLDSGEIVYDHSGYLDYSGHGNIQLRRSIFDPLEPNESIGSTSSTISAGYNADFWNPNSLTWELGWLPSGQQHRLEQTWSECCAEETETEPLGTTPYFSATSGTRWRQQNAYYWARKTRDWLSAQVWTPHPATNPANVRVNTDSTGSSCGVGCYMSLTHSIYISGGSLASSFSVPSHEYGHYLVDSYGNLDDTCSHQINEGRAINEAIADVVSWAAILTSSAIGGTYTSEFDYLTRRLDATQHNESIYTYLNVCNTLGPYQHGDPFRQAVWEIMNNLDCSPAGNCTDATHFGNDIWLGGESRTTVTSRVGRAVGKALKSTPTNTTFSSIIAWMISDINATSGTATGTRAYSVFEHHGF